MQVRALQVSFQRDGYLVLPKFFDAPRIDAVQQQIERLKLARPFDVVIDNLENGDRTVLGLMSPEAVRHDRMKINDVYLTETETRNLALDSDLVAILDELLEYTPALCNSLYLEKGTQQAPHVDSLYMTPRTGGHLIAAWVALEDTVSGSGELEYFPRSHAIEPMTFSNGTNHFIESEMDAWRDYMHQEITGRNLSVEKFSARKGDVFLWHANLLHGGGLIGNHALTRKSCVFHYFSETDARASGCSLVPHGAAFWIDRPPQALPKNILSLLPFSEKAYLKRYSDVAAAVDNGMFATGKMHYDLYGRQEERMPC